MSDLVAEEFDLMFLFSSWDRRAVSIAACRRVRASVCVVVLFDFRDAGGIRDKQDAELVGFANMVAAEVVVVRGDSLDLANTWANIRSQLIGVHERKGRPLKILVDASVSPRFYFLGLIATALSSGLAATVAITYAEGVYPQRGATGDEEISFTRGQWKSVAVPGLEGKYSPGLKRFYLVSVGFEGWKTMRAVSRSDPDRVSILLGDPGTDSGYAARSLSDNKALLDYYRVPEGQILRASAADAVSAWGVLSMGSVERIDENCYFLCSGTKPHSLALSLRALSLRSPAVLYNLPEGHQVVVTEPNGMYWRYDIESLTVPR